MTSHGYSITSPYTLFTQDLVEIDEHLSDVILDLKDAHIFLTGATGFFGRWIVESFHWLNTTYSLNARMTALSRDPNQYLEKNLTLTKFHDVTFLAGDICSFTFPEVPVSHIIHAASEGNLAQSSSWASSHLRSTLLGADRVVELAQAHKVKALLYTSSGAAYPAGGGVKQDSFVEEYQSKEAALTEKNVYGAAKRSAELQLIAGAEDIGCRSVIARCFAFVGSYLPLTANYAIGNFLHDALTQQPIVIKSDGSALRSYLYASDLVVWLWTLLLKGESGRVYNVGSSNAISIAELAKTVSRVLGSTTVEILGKPQPGSDRSIYLPNVEQAFSLGLKERVGLEEAIIKTASWYKRMF